jgi:hypothetical protein
MKKLTSLSNWLNYNLSFFMSNGYKHNKRSSPVYKLGIESFGSQKAFERWLKGPNFSTGKKNTELNNSQLVDLLIQIQHDVLA